MKIMVVQDRLRSGGTERQSILLAHAFARAGHRSTLLSFRPGGELAATVEDKVERVVLQPFDLGADWFAPGLAATARERAPDVILCMGRMANSYAGGLQRQLPATRVIGTLRTGKTLPIFYRRSLHQVAHVVANSREARDHLLAQHRLPPERVSVIHNSLVFPLSVTPAATPELRMRHGARASTFVLLNVAMFRPEKRQQELLETVATLPSDLDWQLWLVGEGPTRAACARAAQQLGIETRVKFLGFQPDPRPLYAAADAAVHASEREALSNFLIEAQAFGLPAVAFAAQGIQECFIPDDTGWMLPRGKHDAFRQRLVQLATASAEERRARADRAREFARRTFDPARQVTAYLDLFQRLLPAPQLTAP